MQNVLNFKNTHISGGKLKVQYVLHLGTTGHSFPL